jgi:hypothetical protein
MDHPQGHRDYLDQLRLTRHRSYVSLGCATKTILINTTNHLSPRMRFSAVTRRTSRLELCHLPSNSPSSDYSPGDWLAQSFVTWRLGMGSNSSSDLPSDSLTE